MDERVCSSSRSSSVPIAITRCNIEEVRTTEATRMIWQVEGYSASKLIPFSQRVSERLPRVIRQIWSSNGTR